MELWPCFWELCIKTLDIRGWVVNSIVSTDPHISSPMLSPLSAWGLYKLLSASTRRSDKGFTWCQKIKRTIMADICHVTMESQNFENLSWPKVGSVEHSGAAQELLRRRRGATGRALSSLGSGKNMPQRKATLTKFDIHRHLMMAIMYQPFVNSANFVNILQLGWGNFVRQCLAMGQCNPCWQYQKLHGDGPMSMTMNCGMTTKCTWWDRQLYYGT